MSAHNAINIDIEDSDGGPKTPPVVGGTSTPCKRKNISLEEYTKRRAVNTSNEQWPDRSHYGYTGESPCESGQWTHPAEKKNIEETVERVVAKQMAAITSEFQNLREILTKMPTPTSEKKPPINESDLRKKKRLDEIYKLLDSFLQMEPGNIVDKKLIADSVTDIFDKLTEVAKHFCMDTPLRTSNPNKENLVCGCELCVACASRLRERGITTECSCGRCLAHKDEVRGVAKKPMDSGKFYQPRRPWRGSNRGGTRGRIQPRSVSSKEFDDMVN